MPEATRGHAWPLRAWEPPAEVSACARIPPAARPRRASPRPACPWLPGAGGALPPPGSAPAALRRRSRCCRCCGAAAAAAAGGSGAGRGRCGAAAAMAGRWGGGCGGHRGAAGTGGTAHTGGAPRTGGTAQRERYGWDFVRRGGTVRRGGSALGAVVERGYRAAGVRCAGGTGGWAWLRVPLDGGEQSGEGGGAGFCPRGCPRGLGPSGCCGAGGAG